VFLLVFLNTREIIAGFRGFVVRQSSEMPLLFGVEIHPVVDTIYDTTYNEGGKECPNGIN
jgi:hypothetical protein